MMFEYTTNAQDNLNLLPGSRVAVLGAARSGLAVSRLLASAGARILLSDKKSVKELNLPADSFREQGIRLETGGHSPAVLESDLIVISPGLPLDIPVLVEAQKQGIPVAGEIEVASWFCKSPIVAITGSNGKTTTTTLSGNILRRAFPGSIVAGNIGQPFAEQVGGSRADAFAVLEVSSFQLETIRSFHPKIAVIMNLTANHLDRYPDFESYARAKLNILNRMNSEDILIYNRDDQYLNQALREAAPVKLTFSLKPFSGEGAFWQAETIHLRYKGRESLLPIKGHQLRGPHNRYNMMVAALLGKLLQTPVELIREEIEGFPGIEHRLEVVRKLNGITFVNDSKATTVDSLCFALQSFREKIVLIAGGKDKGGNYGEALPFLKGRIRCAVLIGQAAERIRAAWEGNVPLESAKDLSDAVQRAVNNANKGDVVLLSPACSSYDMFIDYEERGRVFKSIVERLGE